MANAAANEGRGAKRFGRLASRALFVVGGAVAGTAAAWLVSGAAASASSTADAVQTGTASVTPVTDATTAGLNDATGGASRFAGQVAGAATGAVADLSCQQDATTWSMPQTAGEPGGSHTACAVDTATGSLRQHGTHRSIEQKTSDRVTGAVSGLASDAVVAPAERTLGAFEHIARKPEDTRQVLGDTFTPAPGADDFGRKVWQLLDPNAHHDFVPTLPGLPVSPVEPVTPATAATGGAPGQVSGPVEPATVQLPAALQAANAMPGAAQNVSDLDGSGTERSSRNGHRDLPSAPLSPVQLPLAPPSIPTAPGGGSAPGGHLDGMTFGVPSWVAAAVDNAVAGATRSGLRHTPLSPGHQPGVTPD
ncbi:hypothetical protein [Amycolatopsis sp. NPDC058986]|uniref:hypothetical protein n=1 Tax=unclassified Amycolatopsis TaxID=2618356 RepID=UPI00366BEE02